MGQYLGRENSYGVFEKQNIIGDGITTEFVLDFTVGSASSILVVVVSNNTTKILEPNFDYAISDGGKKIVFVTAPEAVDLMDSDEERVFIIFLGKQLAVPANPGRSPLLVQTEVAVDLQTEFVVSSDVVLTEHGLIVFKNKQLQRFVDDFTIVDNKVVFNVGLSIGDLLDFYVFGGIERLTLNLVDDDSISTQKIADKQVTVNKLNIAYNQDYSTTIQVETVSGMNVDSVDVQQAVYQELGDSLVKIKLKLVVALSGIADNKIRISLPKPNNGNTAMESSTTISTDAAFESGIVKWGGENSIDIYRQFAVNYSVPETYTIETVVEYEQI